MMKKSAYLIAIFLSCLICLAYGDDCHFDLPGDVNYDCKVDLVDVTLLAQRWLIDCHAEPLDAECIPLDLDEDGFDVISDCNDHNISVYPGAIEVCDNYIDDDCDGFTDCDDDDCDGSPSCGSLWYRDADEDTYGDPGDSMWSVTQPEGYVLDNTDCDDGDADVNPDATEICDGMDNDCNPSTLDGDEDPQLGASCDGMDSDLCMEGIYNSCSGGALNCSDNTSSNLDVCDGMDNDCDASSADGSEDPQLGASCDGMDSDLCMEGIYNSCSGGSLNCSDNTSSNLDVCDGMDNDCDASSADGSEDPQLGAPCDGPDSDFCEEGINYCSGGSMNCSDTSGNDLEICDDTFDNDCDGDVDGDDSDCPS